MNYLDGRRLSNAGIGSIPLLKDALGCHRATKGVSMEIARPLKVTSFYMNPRFSLC